MKRRNWILLLLLLPLFLALAGIAAVLLIPTERVGALAADRATAMLGREVTIEGVSLTLFPRPAVALSGVAVAGRVQDETPVATVSRVQLRPRILPLLKRQVVIDAIVLDEPRILVAIDANSISNLPVLGGGGNAEDGGETTSPAQADPEAAGETAPREGAGLAFLIRRLEINDAHLAYRDERTGAVVTVGGLDQRLRLSGDLAGGQLQRIALDGTVAIDSLSAHAPEQFAVPIEGLRLRVEHRAALDLAGDSLSLDRLAVTIQEFELEGEGTVLALSDPEARTVSLRLGAGSADVGQLLRSLPGGLLALTGPDGNPTAIPEVDGVLRIDVAIAGPLGTDSLPEVDGTASFEHFTLGYGEMGELVSDLDGTIAFSLDSVTTTGLTGRLLGEPLFLEFAVHDLAAPRARSALKGAVDLNTLEARGLLPDSVAAAGRIALDLRVQTPLLTPEEGTVDGAIELQSLRLRAPAVLEPVSVESGTIAFEGQRLLAQEIAVQLGKSDLTLNLDARDWLPFALGDSAALPRVTVDTRSKLLDLDAILGPADTLGYGALLFARMAERPIDGRPVEALAEEAGLGLPAIPPMELEADLRIDEMRRDALLLRDVAVGLAANGDRLELTDASFQMMGGGIQVAAQIGMPLAREGAETEVEYPVVFSFQVQDVGAAPFFDTFTPFREHLSGSLLMAGTGRAVLDRHLLPLRESIAASGTVLLSEGQLVNWPALQKLGEELSAVGFDTLTFKDWAGQFSISGPRIMLHETAIEGGKLGIRAAGELGFNGVLDLGATVNLPPELSARIRGELASRLTDAVKAEDGSIPIGVKVTGPALSPKLEVDFSAAAANLAAEARREAEAKLKVAEEKARATAEAAAKEAAARAAAKLLPGGDSLTAERLDSLGARLRLDSLGARRPDSLSLPAAADTARAKVEKKVRDRLCGIIRC